MLPPIRNFDKERLCGYPGVRFLTPPNTDFLCVLCGYVVREPLECKKCFRIFCTLCLICKDRPNPEISMDLHCPTCGPQYKPQKPSKILTQIINELKIFCKYQNNGCTENTPVRKIASHEVNCKYKIVECENIDFCKAKDLAYKFIETQVANIKHGKYVCSKKCKKILKFQSYIVENNYQKALRKYLNCIKQTT